MGADNFDARIDEKSLSGSVINNVEARRVLIAILKTCLDSC